MYGLDAAAKRAALSQIAGDARRARVKRPGAMPDKDKDKGPGGVSVTIAMSRPAGELGMRDLHRPGEGGLEEAADDAAEEMSDMPSEMSGPGPGGLRQHDVGLGEDEDADRRRRLGRLSSY